MIRAALVCLLPGIAVAQEPLPDFATCLDIEVARFERALTRKTALPEPEFDIGGTRGVAWCGSVGMVRCDRSDAPHSCQHGLAAKQDAVGAAVRETLPDPEAVTGQAGQWSDELYPRIHALAHGTSAGPDCGGATEAMTAWCQAWEANNRLRSAILAWQLARYLGAAPKATEAGWADPPPPVRPVARPRD